MNWNKCVLILLVSVVIVSGIDVVTAVAKTTVRLGYFEAGEHPIHDLLREEFYRQLQAIAPDSLEIVFIPQGYGNGDWKRDSCRVLAEKLAQEETIDLLVTVGPWVVEDLLAVNCRKPILAMHQLDPAASGFVDRSGHPIVDNLTVHTKPNKIEDDLAMLVRLAPVKKLGVLIFPSDSLERNAVVTRIRYIAKQLRCDIVTSEGYDNFGTYAFFKAAQGLDKDVDAIYLGPLWGMNITKINAFLSGFVSSRIPVFTYEGKFLVDRGAFATNSGYSLVSEARFNALKALKIIQGIPPSDLPVEFRGGTSLVINKETADQCRIELSSQVLNEAEIVDLPFAEGKGAYFGLSDAVARGLAANPGYLAAYDALEQATQAAAEARTAYLPKVHLSARGGYVDDNTVANTNEPIDNSQYRASLILQQNIFSLDAINSIKLAGKQKKLSGIDQFQARLDLELAVTFAYISYLQAQELLGIHQRYRQIVERNLELAATRFYVESENYPDFIRWQDERQQAINMLITAKAEVDIARVLLNSLFNLPPDQYFSLDTNVVCQEAFYSSLTFLEPFLTTESKLEELRQSLVASARTSNPDLRAYDLRHDIQRSLLSRNTGRFFPSVDIKARVNWADELTDTIAGFEEQHNTWSIFGEISLPLFAGTERYRERSRLKAELSEIEYRKDAAMLELTGKVRQELSNLFTLVHTVPRSLSSQEMALQNLGLMSAEYDAGRIKISDFMEAYHHARDVELTAVTERIRFFYTMAGLVHELGLSVSETHGTFQDVFRKQVQDK